MQMTNFKIYYVVIAGMILVILGIFSYVKSLDEDSWICENGKWTQHGNPLAPMPLTGCADNGAVDGNTCATITDMDACTKRNDCVAVDDTCSCYTYNNKAKKCGGAVAFCEVCETNTHFRCESLQCPNANVQMSADSLALTADIKGCADTAKKTKSEETLSAEVGINVQPPSITVMGQTVIYSRAIQHACCLEVAINKAVDSSTIKLTESWSGTPCKCSCTSQISTTVSDLPQGSYRLEVYEKGGATSLSASADNLIISKPIIIE